MTVTSAGPSRYNNNPSTTLNGAIGGLVSNVTIVVTSALGFPIPGPFRILIENEQMQVIAGYGTTTWTVIRAVENTAVAPHGNGAAVINNITAFDYNSYRAEFNPLAYGALGDGSTNDAVAFQNAITDAAALNPQGHVFLPDLPFVINTALTNATSVVFVTYGAAITGTQKATVTPLIRWGPVNGVAGSTGALTIPGPLVVQSGGIAVTGTTTFNTVALTWPVTAGTSGQFLKTDGVGTLSWSTVVGGVTSVTGTGGQITASPTTGAVVLTLPSGGTLPGAWSAASTFTVTTGGLVISAGGLTVSAGGANITGGITGVISTAAQTNITSVGTLTALDTSAPPTFPSSSTTTPTWNGTHYQGVIGWGNQARQIFTANTRGGDAFCVEGDILINA